jgi:hypothetical protein
MLIFAKLTASVLVFPNGDGLSDLIVGAYKADVTGINEGKSYVVFGKSNTNAVDLSSIAAGTGGFVINQTHQ